MNKYSRPIGEPYLLGLCDWVKTLASLGVASHSSHHASTGQLESWLRLCCFVPDT